LKIPFSTSIFTAATWIFQLSYYLYGYHLAYGTSTEYLINWLMPGCIMCLKNIALFTDCCDGLKPDEKVKPDRKDTVIRDYPDPVELIGYMTLYNSILIGPQMTLSHYRKFVNCVYIKNYGDKFHNETLKISVFKLLFGAVLLGFFAINGQMHDDTLWNNPQGEFFKWSFLRKVTFITIYGNGKFIKYMSTWNLVESGLVLSGASTVFEKIKRSDKEKSYHHYHQTNANISAMFSAVRMNDYVAHFNINTNKWCFTYLFKRLAFLGNKDLSQLLTLVFLATWHGTWLGYYTCFIYEFMVINIEKKLVSVGWLQDTLFAPEKYEGSRALYFLKGCFQKVFWFSLISGYCHIDFGLLDYRVYLPVMKSVYFYGHFLLFIPFVAAIMIGGNRKSDAKKDN